MTTPLSTEASDAWRTLEVGGGSDEFSLAAVRLSLDAGYGPVRLARAAADEWLLLVPTAPGRRLPDSLSGEAVGVRVVQFVVAGRTQPFIELRCLTPELQGPFRSLVDDVLRRLQQGTGPEQAVAAAIAEFRDLLRRQRSLSIEALVGLFGELRLLGELLKLDANACASWTGPLGQRHDFSSPTLCAEVKSTLKRDGQQVRISSLDQLQQPSGGRSLILIHTVLERAGTGGSTVRDLVAECMRLAVDPSLLDRALAALQIEDWRSNENLAAERFNVLRVVFYQVVLGFPTLVRDSLKAGAPAPGITGIQYTLDLDHAKTWEINPSGVQRALQMLAGRS